ncbi:N-acetylmuramoyl-L-alanine amidase [Candidatus Sumerlaeota bacterium]|nr:N-acetylmuramoyl-L-alanine amidase [Candidatus Sumerlaeota bacterium]
MRIRRREMVAAAVGVLVFGCVKGPRAPLIPDGSAIGPSVRVDSSAYEGYVPELPLVYERPETERPTEFDERWYRVRPRTEEGVYPNLPADWEAMDNRRYAVPDDRPLEGLRICVDAGHGGQVWGPTHGYTGGTRGTNTGFNESEANLRTAFFLWDLLTQAGAEVTMTRTRPDRMSATLTEEPPEGVDARQFELMPRVAIAAQAGCDHFITIHHNAGRANYVSCFYFDTREWDDEYNESAPYIHRCPDEALSEESSHLAMEIQSAMSRRLNLRVISPQFEWDRYYGRGVPGHSIWVLRESKLPAVLVEVSFMTDPDEDLRLNDPARAKQAAIGIFEGILAHFEHRPMVRWSERPLAEPTD